MQKSYQTLFERLENLNNPYSSLSEKYQRNALKNSVFNRIEAFLLTPIKTVPIDPSYGMETPSVISELLFGDNPATRTGYINSLKVRIEAIDSRIQRIDVRVEEHQRERDKKSIPFIEINVLLNQSFGLTEYGDLLNFKMAYDMIGRIFEIKETENT